MPNYIVNTEQQQVEMREGLLSGLLDKETLQDVIRELTEVQKMFQAK